MSARDRSSETLRVVEIAHNSYRFDSIAVLLALFWRERDSRVHFKYCYWQVDLMINRRAIILVLCKRQLRNQKATSHSHLHLLQ